MHNSQCTIVVSLRDIFKRLFSEVLLSLATLLCTYFAFQRIFRSNLRSHIHIARAGSALGGLNEDLFCPAKPNLTTSRLSADVRTSTKLNVQTSLSYQPFSLPISLLWWAEEDSNLRPLGYQPSALTS